MTTNKRTKLAAALVTAACGLALFAAPALAATFCNGTGWFSWATGIASTTCANNGITATGRAMGALENAGMSKGVWAYCGGGFFDSCGNGYALTQGRQSSTGTIQCAAVSYLGQTAGAGCPSAANEFRVRIYRP